MLCIIFYFESSNFVPKLKNMKKNTILKSTTIILIFLITSISSQKSLAQVKNLSGPRIGFTLLAPGGTADYLSGEDGASSQIMTQYGWQWESRFADGEAFTGLVEWVLLVGGMEKGKFLPSVSSLVGFRSLEGFEIAAGPNLSAGGLGMVAGFGFTMTQGNLNIPINFVFSPKKEWSGAGFSVLIGFNMSKGKVQKMKKSD